MRTITKTLTKIVTTDSSITFTTDDHSRVSVQAVCDEAVCAAAACASASAINATTNAFTKASHGLTTGLKVQVTTSTTLPTGISALTDYFVVVVDVDTFKLSDTLAHALAGTNIIDISDVGTGTQTFTPVALAGCSVKWQKSNDGTNWDDIAAATNITADGNVWLTTTDVTHQHIRLYYTLTAGSLTVVNNICLKP